MNEKFESSNETSKLSNDQLGCVAVTGEAKESSW
jgi:hypothetical protein